MIGAISFGSTRIRLSAPRSVARIVWSSFAKMCPSTSWGTRPGSQLGTWLATAVIRPKVKEVMPSSKRMKRRAARRSLRILRRRPLGAGAEPRLRRSKRRSLALSGVLDSHEGLTRRGIGSSGPLLRDHHESPLRDGPSQWNRDHLATVEEARGLGRAAGGHPRLIGPARAGPLELPEDERSVSASRHDERSSVERDRLRVRLSENLRDAFLPRERVIAAVELARERGGPDAKPDRRAGGDGGDRNG